MPPPVALVDGFNRTDSVTLGSKWTDADPTGAIGVLSNVAYRSSGTTATALYNDQIFPANTCAHIIMSTKPGTGGVAAVIARATTLAKATSDGYTNIYQTVAGGSNDTFGIYRSDNGVNTLLGSLITIELANGDGIAIDCINSTIYAYARQSGVWSDVSSGGRSDSTYPDGGYSGFGIASASARVEDFSSGKAVKLKFRAAAVGV